MANMLAHALRCTEPLGYATLGADRWCAVVSHNRSKRVANCRLACATTGRSYQVRALVHWLPEPATRAEAVGQLIKQLSNIGYRDKEPGTWHGITMSTKK